MSDAYLTYVLRYINTAAAGVVQEVGVVLEKRYALNGPILV